MSRRRSDHADRWTKKEPKLKPPQSWLRMRSIEEVRLSPVGERDTGSRNSEVGGCETLSGL